MKSGTTLTERVALACDPQKIPNPAAAIKAALAKRVPRIFYLQKNYDLRM